jgi:tetratricopeptide (TPR) repeat protein
VEEAVRRALVIVILAAAACSAPDPGPRPRTSGFIAPAGVADPYGNGKRHLMAGRYDLAIERFGQALANDRRSLGALNGLAIAQARLGRFDVAQTYFERALQVDSTSAVTLNNYGWALVEQGRLRDATPFLELALRHAPAAEAPVIAANIEKMRRAPPPDLIAVLEDSSEPASPRDPQRLVRVDDDAYRLETRAEDVEPPAPPSTVQDAPLSPSALEPNPGVIGSWHQGAAGSDARSAPSVAAEGAAGSDARPAPSVAAEAAGAAGLAPAAVEHVRAAQPERDNPVTRPSGGAPIQFWPPQPVSESEAGLILPGEKR